MKKRKITIGIILLSILLSLGIMLLIVATIGFWEYASKHNPTDHTLAIQILICGLILVIPSIFGIKRQNEKQKHILPSAPMEPSVDSVCYSVPGTSSSLVSEPSSPSLEEIIPDQTTIQIMAGTSTPSLELGREKTSPAPDTSNGSDFIQDSVSRSDPRALVVPQAIAGDEVHSDNLDAEMCSKPETVEDFAAVAKKSDEPKYIFPPVNLLRKSTPVESPAEDSVDRGVQLESAIRSFGVDASVIGVTHGAAITRYKLRLEPEVKISKIRNLTEDIALSMGIPSVDIRIAPIAKSKYTVGIEVVNPDPQTVMLGNLIDSDAFLSAHSSLSVAVGVDIEGNPIIVDIAKCPHLFITGAMLSGRMTCLNAMILSLLYKSTPDEVRMIMIDPKMVEFVVYNGMPHLYVPVVTDPKKAAGALQWAVVEMLKRYRLFSEAGVRDLAGYNAILQANDQPTLPQVVIFIDELADLMMIAAKEVEESICRIGRMGASAGIHMVLSSPHPGKRVLTPQMKEFIPCRLSFAVSNAEESKNVLEQFGAENLSGNGDMLYLMGRSDPLRVQGAFVTDEEREKIIDFVKQSAEATYYDKVLEAIAKAAAEKDDKGGDAAEAEAPQNDYDELLPQAVEVIFETKLASVSMLQHRLKLGYSRAARLIDQMEEVGVVGPYEGSKPRKIMLTKQQWQEMQHAQGTAPEKIMEMIRSVN